MFKHLLLSLATLLSSIGLSAQENDVQHILTADSTWRSEVFNFPIPFAPEIDFKGSADVRFSKGWAESDQEDFWTYVISWELEENPELTAKKTEDIMALYFDGLMGVVVKDSSLILDKTRALFVNPSSAPEHKNKFVGKVSLFDGFFTNRMVQLHVTSETAYCPQNDSYIVLFRFTPHEFDHPIWDSLNQVTTIVPCDFK